MRTQYRCGTPRRRQDVQTADVDIGGLQLNGIDYLEVLDREASSEADRQRLLFVVFLKPDGVGALTAANIVIDGGERITGIRVTAVDRVSDLPAAEQDERPPGAAADRTLRVRLDRWGDFSPYVLRVVSGPDDPAPPPHIDVILAEVTLSFKIDCLADGDCRSEETCEPADLPAPQLDYLAKDYESFRRLMLDRLATTIPDWIERNPADFGVAIVEVLASAADRLSYHQDAVATEAYLSLARLRRSVRRHARLLDYHLHEGCNARTWLVLTCVGDVDEAALPPEQRPLLPAGTRILTDVGLDPAFPPDPALFREALNRGALVFETMEAVSQLRESRNAMRFHTWGEEDCCLPAGATRAFFKKPRRGDGTFADFALKAGDVLILEEIHRPGGTLEEAPDPSRRQAVRLAADPVDIEDKLTGEQIVEVRWLDADALCFPLSLAKMADDPEEVLASVARGNVVLTDHGRTIDYARPRPEDGGAFAGKTGLDPDDVAAGAAYEPVLAHTDPTYAEPIEGAAARDAARTLRQSPHRAVPVVSLRAAGEVWLARRDLLDSGRFDPAFVVETDEQRGVRLRFGDGIHGKRPGAGSRFTAACRVGNGPDGNIGAEALGHIVTLHTAAISGVRNPLPAVGGTAPEPLIKAKLDAPQAFRVQRRAVTESDYAEAAKRHPDVQRAVATRRWTGSWTTVFLTVDRFGGRPVDGAFEAEIRAHLEPFRLAGGDLEIDGPRFVSLDVLLIVCVKNGYFAADVREALLDVFTSGLRPDGTKGFFHPDNFTFGEPVYLSRIIAAAMQVAGVHWIGTRLTDTLKGHFRRWLDPGTDYADPEAVAEAGVLPVQRLEIARLDNDPNAPERGRLDFILEGGR